VNRDSSVIITSRLRAFDRHSFPGWEIYGNFSLRHRFLIGSHAYPASYALCTGNLTLGETGPRVKLNYLLHLGLSLKVRCPLEPLFQYAFLAFYFLVKHRDNFNLPHVFNNRNKLETCLADAEKF